MTEKRQKKADFKKHRARTHRGDFFTTVQNSYSVPCWGKPQTPKARSKEKMALATLVSSQKQKLTIDKIFMKLDIEKAVFQRGE